MKKLAALLIAASALVSGCAVYGAPYHDRDYYRDHDRDQQQHQNQQRRPVDRDRDGVPDALEHGRDGNGAPNRQDRHPDDAHQQ